ncbi:hypothetical protein VKT23_015598 [Stygiomarasmius scandens]|uniref:Uncharacterized protein n=1 Tax=Marasmiellus scandens TaxID=2682957 RepID=A0ABR1IZX3_9AGAR
MSLPSTDGYPPFYYRHLTTQDKICIRDSIEEQLYRKIRTCALEMPVRVIGTGAGHMWGQKGIDSGKDDWRNVGRVFRRCYNPEHKLAGANCTVRWLSDKLPAALKRDLESLQAIYDMTGTPWSRVGAPVHGRILCRALWEQFENTTIPPLWAIFKRLYPESDYDFDHTIADDNNNSSSIDGSDNGTGEDSDNEEVGYESDEAGSDSTGRYLDTEIPEQEGETEEIRVWFVCRQEPVHEGRRNRRYLGTIDLTMEK